MIAMPQKDVDMILKTVSSKPGHIVPRTEPNGEWALRGVFGYGDGHSPGVGGPYLRESQLLEVLAIPWGLYCVTGKQQFFWSQWINSPQIQITTVHTPYD